MTHRTSPTARIDVWQLPLDGCRRQLIAAADDAERVRAAQFVRLIDGRRYAAAHGALRIILSRVTGIPPRALLFETGEHGKPHLVNRGLWFNLSRSGGIALVAVSAHCEMGVDVERIRPVPAAPELARRYLPAAAAAEVTGLPPGHRRDAAFLERWTAFEATLKAEGSGLGEGAAPARCHSRALPVAPGYVATVAARANDYEIRMRWRA